MNIFNGADMAQLALDSFFSLQRVVLGVLAAALVGVALGLLRSALPKPFKAHWLPRFLIEAPKFPPPIAWIPFVILLFGIGEVSADVIVFIGAFAPIFIATYDGAESVPAVWRQAAASMEIRGGRLLYHIVFKASLPQIFVGLRAGVSMGWMAVIAAEMISGQSGLGYAIQLNRLNLQYDMMIADMLVIGLIGFLLFEGIGWMERLLVPWHERSRAR